jgi:MoaA/NifB/PqqE/SkfB family radical SAM enzyme
MFPWHWMVITNDGDVLPCGHGAKPIGNLRESTAEEVWNGPVLREVRAAILLGRVHPVCRSKECPYQRPNHAFPVAAANVLMDEELARAFDEAWYLETHSDVRVAVEHRRFASGVEHFARHGHAEGRAYQLVARVHRDTPIPNSTLMLIEYTRRATVLRSRPVDLVLAVSTVCNLRCVMCPHGIGAVERPRHMSRAILERAEPFIRTAERMIISGLGEPLIAPGFWHVLEWTSGRGEIFMRVNSNGLLLTPEKAQRLLDSELKEISFSLDAATPETYAKIRGGDYACACDGVRMLCEARRVHPRRKLEIFINMTLMRENLAEAEAFVELGASLGVDAVLFSQLFSFGDDPSWHVGRGEWTFVYSEQMLANIAQDARRALQAAKTRADALGVKLIFLSNTETLVNGSQSEQESPGIALLGT